MNRTILAIALSTLAMTSFSALAQTTSSTDTPRIDAREATQSARIQQGAATGALTPAETARVDRGQARVQSAEAVAKADGTVTNGEKAAITHAQNHQSRVIKRLKHNNRTTTGS
jgi:hypothetical protein